MVAPPHLQSSCNSSKSPPRLRRGDDASGGGVHVLRRRHPEDGVADHAAAYHAAHQSGHESLAIEKAAKTRDGGLSVDAPRRQHDHGMKLVQKLQLAKVNMDLPKGTLTASCAPPLFLTTDAVTLPSLAGGSRTPTIVPFTFRARTDELPIDLTACVAATYSATASVAATLDWADCTQLEVSSLLAKRFGNALGHADLLVVFTSNYALHPVACAALETSATFGGLRTVRVDGMRWL